MVRKIRMIGFTYSLCLVAEFLGNGVNRVNAGDVDNRVLNDTSVLDVDAADLLEVAVVTAVIGNELSDDSHLLGGIDGLAAAVVGGITHTEGVEIATILVANTLVTVGTVVTALESLASVRAVGRAGVWGVSSGHGVGFPDILQVVALE